jgi:hypothetical protein
LGLEAVVDEFVSETITPHKGAFDTAAMAAGEPGLPNRFTWRDASYEIVERLESWKQSGPEKGSLHGERYLRRHYFRLRMSDASVWTVYFTRQPTSGGSGRSRWFLYGVETKDQA